MKAVVQRVAQARSTPGGAIDAGLCILLGVAAGDDAAAAERLAGKVARLRLFEDEAGTLRALDYGCRVQRVFKRQ